MSKINHISLISSMIVMSSELRITLDKYFFYLADTVNKKSQIELQSDFS